MPIRAAWAAIAIVACAPAPAVAQEMITLDAAAIAALSGKAMSPKIEARPMLAPGGDVLSLRVTIAANSDIPPHPHPAGKVAIVTVLSGDFKVGLGDTFSEAGLKNVAPGGIVIFRDTDPQHYARTGNAPVELLLMAAAKDKISPALLGAKAAK